MKMQKLYSNNINIVNGGYYNVPYYNNSYVMLNNNNELYHENDKLYHENDKLFAKWYTENTENIEYCNYSLLSNDFNTSKSNLYATWNHIPCDNDTDNTTGTK